MTTFMPAGAPRRQTREVCQQPASRPQTVDRWDLLHLVIELRKRLGITDREITVLRAHLSVLPHGPLDPARPAFSFMRVGDIIDRANGMEPRRFRRGEARLESIGLVRRKLSANGRRFPERDGDGQIVAAYGIDLSPLIGRYTELVETRDAMVEAARRFRAVRNDISARIQSLVRSTEVLHADLRARTERLRDVARALLRRVSTTLHDLQNLDRELTEIERDAADDGGAPSDQAPCEPSPPALSPESRDRAPREVSAAPLWPSATGALRAAAPDKTARDDGQIVRRIESEPKDINRTSAPGELPQQAVALAWTRCATITSLYPDMPPSVHGLGQLIQEFSSFLGLGQDITARAVGLLGWDGALLAIDYLAEKIQKIDRPRAYLEAMLSGYRSGKPIAGGRVQPLGTAAKGGYAAA
ncbi:hypothetical protein OCH239_09850 [Roseivivax halodurans JCM 10272]|uniref:Plasmid replication protein C N-terminal domain-containing protein n=1 Tax=Roseivivax halodurans JCM 10272 TaxID=1449350 RepID=X7EEM3_9RHOB|nr:helix-turn-helix domain-containing protein [Roseivivax halodurans]ETX13573.1 hypothetical protein OCH239_09850 [Roseivivax halodurans JCM 10272]